MMIIGIGLSGDESVVVADAVARISVGADAGFEVAAVVADGERFELEVEGQVGGEVGVGVLPGRCVGVVGFLPVALASLEGGPSPVFVEDGVDVRGVEDFFVEEGRGEGVQEPLVQWPRVVVPGRVRGGGEVSVAPEEDPSFPAADVADAVEVAEEGREARHDEADIAVKVGRLRDDRLPVRQGVVVVQQRTAVVVLGRQKPASVIREPGRRVVVGLRVEDQVEERAGRAEDGSSRGAVRLRERVGHLHVAARELVHSGIRAGDDRRLV
mmetsp:Transcript_19569/g.62870  ORF Transcript_19569/g.62870 Transcript_19569/m.62870 type:complete len:269 (-) Transcript_19569:57-863(-)